MDDLNSRRKIFDHFEETIDSAYNDLQEDQKLSYESYLLKTFIIESNFLLTSVSEKLLIDLFSYYYKKNRHIPEVNRIEENLYTISYNIKNDNQILYIEIKEDRFWYIFTLAKAKFIDTVIPKIVKNNPEIDRVWLWPEFLEILQSHNYIPKGFGLDYDNRIFDNNHNEERLNYLKMQVWGGNITQEVYEQLKNVDIIKDKIILSKIRFKNQCDDRSVIEDLRHDAKITTKGNSIDLHLNIVNQIYEQYNKVLMKLRNKYQLSWVKSKNTVQLRGEPLLIKLPHENLIDDDILSKIFNGSDPFRLLGIIESKGRFKNIDVFDLHVGGKFNIIIDKEYLVIYLSKGICPNTVIRLYVNLIHTLGSNFSLLDVDQNKIV